MIKSILKFLQIVVFVVASAALLLAIFYSAYILVFLIVIGFLFVIGFVVTNWEEIVHWIEED